MAQQAVATALGSPDPIVHMAVLATGSPWDRWLLQDALAAAPSSPSTPLLLYRWLLQDLTPAVPSGQQHRAASSCSQRPPKWFHSRAHPARHFAVNSFPWHTKSEFLASSTCVASQGLPCHSGSHNRALWVRVWVSALGPLPWTPFPPPLPRGSGWFLHLLLCTLQRSLHWLGNPLLLL